ncbi:T9SS type A sorting domain-containing protein [uncultured Algibacter sp.]|uniref:T9SS type A sorting domain-containing protein n=1 Tax=uncultured Algibacter sp. TaxID=298659 RepID=UPI003216E38E
MKFRIFILMLALVSLSMFSQNIYKFTGNGDWTDTSQWENGSYPGIVVQAGDVVMVTGGLRIMTKIINYGTIESSIAVSSQSSINIINGSLINFNKLTINETFFSVGPGGKLLVEDFSEFLIGASSGLSNLGDISVSSEGIIKVSGSLATFSNNNSFENLGTIEIIEGKFANRTSVIGSPVINNSGQFTVFEDGEITNLGDFINNSEGVITCANTFTNGSNGKINNLGVMTITGALANLTIDDGSLTNSNLINIENTAKFNVMSLGSFTSNGNVFVSSNCEVVNQSNAFLIKDGKFTNNGILTNQSSISIASVGELQNNGSITNSFTGSKINNLGLLSGFNSQHIGGFFNDGAIAPGNFREAVGRYSLDALTQTSTASLNINLAGTLASTTYDQLFVSESVVLNGTLNVSLLFGFEPEIGDAFTILKQGGAILNTFSTINLPVLPLGRVWDTVNYSNDGVVISVIEDPDLSISDNNGSLKLIFYPNPVIDKVFVSGIFRAMDASIFNLNGQKIMETSISNKNSSIGLSKLSSGIYLLKIEESTFKFLKK